MKGFRNLALITVIALSAGIACSPEATAQGQGTKGTVLATVNGVAITEADVATSDAVANLDREYKRNRHALIEESLKAEVQKRILEAEAKSRSVSTEQLLAGIAPEPVTQEAIDAVYEENRAQLNNVPKAQVEGQIRTYLGQQAQKKARDEFFEALEEKYKVDISFEPLREVVAATGASKGPANAPVTIVEFSEFQCPFCSRVNPALEQVRQKYGDKVRIVFRHFPLPFHQNAQKASEASLCALDQGKFWELHDAMFANQNALAVEQLKEKAVQLGLDAAKFNSCLDSGQKAEAIAVDKRDGEKAGVTGTPGMFINGRFVNGAVPLETLATIIDDELRRKGVSRAGSK